MTICNIHSHINTVKRAQDFGTLDQFELMMKRHEEMRRLEKANQSQFNLPELANKDAQRSKLEQAKQPTAPQSYDPKAPQKPQNNKPKKEGLEEIARKMADAKGNNNGKLDPEEEGDYKAILAQLQAAESGGGDEGGAPPSLGEYRPPSGDVPS